MERDILADVDHPFIVKLNYGTIIHFCFLLQQVVLFAFVFILKLMLTFE